MIRLTNRNLSEKTKDNIRIMATDFLNIKVSDIMKTEDIPLVKKSAPIKEIMPFPQGHSHAWVVEREDGKKVVGIVTEHDILSVLSPDKPSYILGFPDMRTLCADCPIEDIMTKEVIEITSEETLREALKKLANHRISRLPVLNKDGEILGEIHKSSIMNRLSEEFGEL